MSGLSVYWKKIIKLDIKLVNILKRNKIIFFDYVFSTRKTIICLSTAQKPINSHKISQNLSPNQS